MKRDVPGVESFVSYAGGRTWNARLDGDTLLLQSSDAQEHVWTAVREDRRLRLNPLDTVAADPLAMAAALDAAFALLPDYEVLTLDTPALATEVPSAWCATDPCETGAVICRDLFWQTPVAWRSVDVPQRGLRYVMTEDRRHPLRDAKPHGTVYQRHIPWLDRTLSLRTIDTAQDLPAFHRWMNDPAVAEFWQEQGDMDKHRTYLETIAHDPRTTGLLACLDGVPFGYFEAYWAKEDRIAPFCDATDYDRGWHVLIGEPAYRGRPFVTAWMPSISHYLFLDDCRTQRLVIEPRSDNQKMLKSLGKCGYALLKAFDFPHKRAMLGTLSRERFFSEALWHPREAH